MRKDINNIEIKEPPIEELKKKRSCLKRSCTTGCGCVIILVIIFLLLLKFVATPRPKELKNLPETFPQDVIVYDEENVEYITFASGKQKNRLLEVAAYIPKAVLMPIFINAESYAPQDVQDLLKSVDGESGWNKFTYLMKQPLTSPRDKFEMKWLELSAEPEFIKEFYETELYKKDFELDISTETENIKQITFSKETAQNIQVVLYINDNPNKKGTDVVILTITLSEKEQVINLKS